MKNILKTILPSPTAALLTLFLPVLAAIYFAATHYAGQIITSEEVAFANAQSDILGSLFFSTELIDIFNRTMDFVFWGVIALVVMVLIWVVSSIRVSIKNHYAQEEFTNFRENRLAWHQHYFAVFILRIILVVLIAYSVLSIIGKALPRLSVDVVIVAEQFGAEPLQQTFFTILSIIGFQMLVISCVKIFRHLQSE